MTMINTTDDLLRAARNNPEFRAAMRRELLGEDLLETPQRIARLEQGIAALTEQSAITNLRLDQIDKRLDQMDERFNRMDRRLDQMDRRLDQMDERLNQMDRRLDQMDERLGRVEEGVRELKEDMVVVKRDIDGLGNAFRQEVKAQSSFRGNYAQATATADRREIASLFADRHGLNAEIDAMLVSSSTTRRWLRENIESVRALKLRGRAMRTFLQPDLIAEVKHLLADDDEPPAFYIAVEASYTADEEDITKVTDHAKIVRAVTGLTVYPVVAAVMLDDKMSNETRSRLYENIDAFMPDAQPDTVYWYPLYSADLRPDEPR